MNTVKRILPVFVFVVALAGLSGSVFAAEDAAQPYEQYRQTIQPLAEQLFEKQNTLRELQMSGQRDDAKARQLFQEIADIKAKIFAAESELQASSPNALPYGMHHGGGYGYGYGHRGGMMGNGMMGNGGHFRGGYRGHGGGHHGW